MSPVRVRAMQAADLNAVLAIAASLPSAPHWPRVAYLAALSDRSTPLRIALVATDATGIVTGFAIASLLPPEAELETIAVAPERQRQGVGRELLAVLAEALRRRDHHIINLYARNAKRGYKLELERKRVGDPEWSVRYDRASERDRLCDWLRWQKPRFGAFLDHAARHGPEALTRLLIDEMFETERRIKKEGRGAGGLRPLRMWRGD